MDNCEMTSVRVHANKQVLSIYRAKRNNKNDENNTWSDVNGNKKKSTKITQSTMQIDDAKSQLYSGV